VFVLARFFRPHRGRLLFVLALGMSVAIASACEPLLLKAIFDAVGHGLAPERVALPLVWLAVLFFGREGLVALLDVNAWRVRLSVNFEVLGATVDRLHALPLSHHREAPVGAVMTKMERGISAAMNAFSEIARDLVPSIVYLTIAVSIMFGLDARLAVVTAVFAPLPIVLGARASREQVERERELMSRWSRIFARLNEVLAGIVVVKSFVREDDEKHRFLHGVAEANACVARGISVDARTTLAKNMTTAIVRLAVLATGAILVVQREISLGTLVAFVGYVAGVFQPMHVLSGIYQTLCKGAVAAESITDLLTAEDGVPDAPNARDIDHVDGVVTFERVRFGYGEEEVLRGIDLHVEAGTTIALVGASGSGKSTLMALLQRLYDPTSGRILIDGQDIRGIKQRSLRRHIGVVLQDGLLFDDTVEDNILFGRPGATQREIEAAARAANAHDFITALPQGYGTRIGERGSRLSGGERQRLAIARALLKDAPILVLDEATSALDAANEDAVREALLRLRQGRTTFVIAHRLSTVVEADRILVMKDGAIVQSGRHEDLLASSGLYAELVARQTRRLTAA
jgi:ATP-binding cassette, subfamily B, bacterial